MSIEIKELHVNLHLNDASKDDSNLSQNSCNSSAVIEKQAVVEDAVKRVLRILKEKEQR